MRHGWSQHAVFDEPLPQRFERTNRRLVECRRELRRQRRRRRRFIDVSRRRSIAAGSLHVDQNRSSQDQRVWRRVVG